MNNFPWEYEDENVILFWGGVFSNWFPSDIVLEGVEYDGVEQYMMAEKARRFGDDEILEKIMATPNPREQKALGRQVRGFDADIWLEECCDLVYPAIRAKFEQNPDLLGWLEKSGNRLIAEASPVDRIWGIGLAPDNPLARDPKNWEGKNFLGKLIMQARDELVT